MISWGDVYKVAAAMLPLYVPLLLGFFSVRWWKIFTPEQCESVNSLVAFFAIPFFTFGFTVHIDPLHANYRAIAADVVSKFVIATVIGAWVLFTRGHNAVNWSITSFSLSTLTSSLVVGVPMAQAMYGEWAQQLVVQLSVFLAIVWITLLLFALEFRKATLGTQISSVRADHVPDFTAPSPSPSQEEGRRSRQINDDIEACPYAANDVSATSVRTQPPPPPPPPSQVNGDGACVELVTVAAEGDATRKTATRTQIPVDDDPADSTARCPQIVEDIIADNAYTSATFPQSLSVNADAEESTVAAEAVAPAVAGCKQSIWTLVKVVSYKIGCNPNTYASVGGIIWACIANRLQICLPIIIENSIGIMGRCGNGLSMFSMGLFMAQQDKLIPCGPSLTFLCLVLKFVLDPIAMAVGSFAVGLRGDVIRVAIIQAAVPQSITSFIFAKEYGLHPDVLSTAVILGMLVSVPLIILFYVGLQGL